jgi:hypothetical protein
MIVIKDKKLLGLIIILIIFGVLSFNILNIINNNNRNEDVLIDINEENGLPDHNSDERVNSPDNLNDYPLFYENSTDIILTKKSTFIKSSIGNSMVNLKVSKNTNAQISFNVDKTEIDSGYAIIILAKNYIKGDGVEFWEDIFFWKQNDIIFENIENPIRHVTMKSGIYDLFILSNFGKWGLTINSDLTGEEFEYEMPIMKDIIFDTIELEQIDNKVTPLKREIQFKETGFDINSKGMLFRFFYIQADLEGHGLESIETDMKLYDPDGNKYSGSSSDSNHIYHNDNGGKMIFAWDVLYGRSGQWKGSGNCTIKTNGKPNIENYNVHMFEFLINFNE